MSVHPRINDSEIPSSDAIFGKALTLVERSCAAEMIEQWRSEDVPLTPRRANALPYTVKGLLVALACVTLRRSEPTLRTVYRTLLDFNEIQLQFVGIDPESLAPVRIDARRSLASFRDWVTRALECMDSAPDQPAQGIPVTEHDKILRQRTPEDREDFARAAERLSIVINRLVAGSIDPSHYSGGRGDVVVDETILDTSQAYPYRDGKKHRSAVYCGGYYRRDADHILNNDTPDKNGKSSKTKMIKKAGWGLGVTAVSSVGPPGAMHTRPTLFTGIAIHPPTSGSLEGLDEAIKHHKANRLDSRPIAAGARWPTLTFDMGYLKDGLPEWQIAQRYAAVFRYPERWNTDYQSADPTGKQPHGPGPIQLAGNWYCPTAADISLGKKYVRPLRDVGDNDDWDAHNQRLSQLLPRLMGVDRRPVMRNVRRGRTAEGEVPEQAMKMVLTCPAAIGNVRCSRWSNPATADRIDLPLVEPPEGTPDYPCCTQPTVTVTLSSDQARMQQHSQFSPGSFDHAVHYEAARSLTERRFSVLKTRPSAGLGDLRYGVRREPFIKLVIAVAIAAVNIAEIERFEDGNKDRPESTRVKWRRLHQDLGRTVVRMPNRS
ncbi:hypothetical protein [Gordonia zhaorongruii]|uniref:hypothetical protein n=1 Tax=Gordonia zhaorongruii TaxID=2597659 RepID=UPI001043B0FC|nr:hypothetical protein [Gordonia zhaorongruii]